MSDRERPTIAHPPWDKPLVGYQATKGERYATGRVEVQEGQTVEEAFAAVIDWLRSEGFVKGSVRTTVVQSFGGHGAVLEA